MQFLNSSYGMALEIETTSGERDLMVVGKDENLPRILANFQSDTNVKQVQARIATRAEYQEYIEKVDNLCSAMAWDENLRIMWDATFYH